MTTTAAENKILKSFRHWNQWIEDHIKDLYFQDVDGETRDLILHAIQHFKHSRGSSSYMSRQGTLILTRDDDTQLINQLSELIHYDIKGIYITVPSRELAFGHEKSKVKAVRILMADQLGNLKTGYTDKTQQKKLLEYLGKKYPDLDKDYIDKISSRFDRRFLDSHNENFIIENAYLFYRAKQDINVKVHEMRAPGTTDALKCIAVASRRSAKTGFLLNKIRIIQSYGCKLERVNSVYIPEGPEDDASLTHYYIRLPGKSKKKQQAILTRMLESLSMVQWIELENPKNQNYVFNLGFSVHHTLFLRSLEEFLYQMLVEVDPDLYTPDNIHEALSRYPKISDGLVSYFSYCFNPVRHHLRKDGRYRQGVQKLIEGIDSGIEVNDERRKTILRLALLVIDHIQKTNYYCLRRSALSFRIDPKILDCVPHDREKVFPELPYAIFFIKGKNFLAFNVRFRDLSRGGVRTLIPRNAEHLAYLQRGIFRECYHLAYTQQKKNKDIPEGGSKSVIFVKPYRGLDRDLDLAKAMLEQGGRSRSSLTQLVKDRRASMLRQQLFDAQRSFCDVLLDILIWHPKKNRLERQTIVDRYGKEELVFLGPDENMTDEMIDWISTRSLERGYRVGDSFMSGKKGAGINHKAYGVTSLGVHVYAKEALRAIGVDLAKGFSVKLSGGPDGDVAGNEIANLIRDFGAKARILAITDGTGTLHDPQGLNQKELMRLFKEQKGVHAFNTERLNPGGFQLLIHEKREIRPGSEEVVINEVVKGQKKKRSRWIGASEANHLYANFLHALETDIFIPCGGRPRTLNIKNWQGFLKADGEPSAKIIVEGANLYLSDEARLELTGKGVLIIKDASANKCGVICSSHEILAGLMVGSEKFIGIKEGFVKDILKILEAKSGAEAKLLLSEWKKGEHNLIELSEKVSERINFYTDLIYDQLPTLKKKSDMAKVLDKVLLNYIPDKLRRKSRSQTQALPEVYRDCIVASSIASHLIYKKGLDYQPSLIDTLGLELKGGLVN